MNDVTTSRTQSTGTPPRDMSLEEFLGVPPASLWARWRKWIIAGVVLLIVVLLLWRFLAPDKAIGYATEDVERGNLTVTVSATGNLQPTNQVQVGSEQSGLVTDVFVDNNDRVTKGQPLARLDTSRLRDTITQNQAAVAAAQAQVAQAQASAVQARANLNRLEEVYRLSGGKVPSKTELDTGRAENLRQIAAVRAANAQVTTARATLSSSETNLRKATIYSPVNGVILQRQIDPGQTVAASFQAPVLFTIAEDLSKMKLEVKVDEADVGQVREGQRATFTVDAYPGRVFPAVISRVDVGSNTPATSGSSSTSSNSASANTVVAYVADLAVQNQDFTLRPGMTATADVVTMEKCNVLLIPNAALRFNPNTPVVSAPSGIPGAMPVRPSAGRPRVERAVKIGRGSRQTVYVLDSNNRPQAVQVTVGDTNGALTEIVGGLKPGQKVITSRLATGAQQGVGAQQASDAQQGARLGGRRGGAGGHFRGQGRGLTTCTNNAGTFGPLTGGRPGGPAGAGGPPGQPGPQAGAGDNGSQGPRVRSGGEVGPQASGGGGGDRAASADASRGGAFRNASPEERQRMRAAFQNASPEERQKMREAWMARRRQAQGDAQSPAGE